MVEENTMNMLTEAESKKKIQSISANLERLPSK